MMKYNEAMINRLKRVEGQARGVIRMMNDEKECKDVVSQLTAMRSAIDKTLALVVGTNLESCIRREMEQGEDMEDTINEAVQMLVKSR